METLASPSRPPLCQTLAVSAERAFAALLDPKALSAAIPDVKSVSVQRVSESVSLVDWTVWLKGFELKWQEEHRVDRQNQRIEFKQTEGMFMSYSGHLAARAISDRESVVEARASLASGMPYIAELVDPVLERAFSDFLGQLVGAAQKLCSR